MKTIIKFFIIFFVLFVFSFEHMHAQCFHRPHLRLIIENKPGDATVIHVVDSTYSNDIYHWSFNYGVYNYEDSAKVAHFQGKFWVEVINAYQCRDTIYGNIIKPYVIYDDSLIPGFSIKGLSNSVLIYPNPSSGEIKIDALGNTTKIQILNSIGQIIKEESVEAKKDFKYNFSPGAYIVNVFIKDKIITKKIIIE